MPQVRKQNVEQNILRSARSVFQKRGYKEATMRDIAKGANITVGNLYRYFSNKDAMYLAIIGSVVEKIDRALIQYSGGQVSFAITPDQALLDDIVRGIHTEQITVGIFRLLPALLTQYRSELLILLQSSRQDDIATFNLAHWISTYLEVLSPAPGIGRYLAQALLYGIETIITSEQDIDLAIQKIESFINLIFVRGAKHYEQN